MDIQPKDTSKGHFYISLIKSVIRIVAGAYLITGDFVIAGLLLITAELLGILEEIVWSNLHLEYGYLIYGMKTLKKDYYIKNNACLCKNIGTNTNGG